MLVAVLVGSAAIAQDSEDELSGVRGRVEPGAVVAAYDAVDGWVRGWSCPEEAAAVDPEGASGAGVTLRLAGRVIGRGESFAGDGMDVWRAARGAMVRAREELPIADDALREVKEREIAKQITIDLEVAGRLKVWLGGTLTSAALTLEPGLDGIAGRVGEKIEGEFPGTMLATGRDPVAGLQVVMGELGLPPLEPAKVREDHGAAFYRFRSTQLAQLRPGDGAVFLHRGGRVVGYNDVSGAAVRGYAERVARHILGREHAPGQLHGTYLAHLGRYENGGAGVREQAVAAYALAYFAGTRGMDDALRRRAGAGARRALDHLRDRLGEDPVDHAAWLIGHIYAEMVGDGTRAMDDGDAQRALEVVIGVYSDTAAWEEIPVGQRALIANAATLGATYSGNTTAGTVAHKMIRELLLGSSVAEIAALMPWIGWAALDDAGDGSINASEALRQFRAMCGENEVALVASGDTADLGGGIAFSRGRRRGVSWQSLRAVAFLASMLGEPRLTSGDEAPGEIGAIRRQLRFALQLEPGREELRMYPDASEAAGGVRVAVWDQRMPLDAASLGLISACETIRSIEGLRDR